MVSIRFSSFLLYRNCKMVRDFEEIEVTVNSKEEKPGFRDFGQEFSLRANFSIMIECTPESGRCHICVYSVCRDVTHKSRIIPPLVSNRAAAPATFPPAMASPTPVATNTL
jgi:hypothetical protein